MSATAWVIQMRKGLADLVVLTLIAQHSINARGIFLKLQSYGTLNLSEGTLYPLLARLKRQGLIRARKVSSPNAPPRKMYSLTPEGDDYLEEIKAQWEALNQEMLTLSDTHGDEV